MNGAQSMPATRYVDSLESPLASDARRVYITTMPTTTTPAILSAAKTCASKGYAGASTFTKQTADGIILTLEVDGDRAHLSDVRSYLHCGDLPVPVALAVWGEVSLFSHEEIRHLIAAARKAGRRKGPIEPGALRAAAARLAGDVPRYEPAYRAKTTGHGGVIGHLRVDCRFAASGKCWGKVESVICRDPLHGRTEQDRCEGHRQIVILDGRLPAPAVLRLALPGLRTAVAAMNGATP